MLVDFFLSLEVILEPYPSLGEILSLQERHWNRKSRTMGKFFATYSALSISMAIGVSVYAWQTRIQFYPMVIFLCTSKFSVAILCNLAVCFTVFLFKAVRTVFLGKLRDAEYEVLAENSKYAFTETCLALTYFRDELNLKVAALFVALLVAKIFHWLCKERISYMESTQSTHLANIFDW